MTRETVKLNDLTHFSPKQEEARKEALRHRYTLYGGAMAGGKSYWLRWMLVCLLIKWASAGHRSVEVGLFCEDYPTLKDRQLSKIGSEFPSWLGTLHGDHAQHGRCYILAEEYGGGVIKFRNLDDPSKYQCFKTGTEILTEEGFKQAEHVKIGEFVPTLDTLTQEVTYQPVEKTWSFDFDGELVETPNNKSLVAFSVTPNHNVPARTRRKNGYTLTRADSLPSEFYVPTNGVWDGVEQKTFEIPNAELHRDKKPTVFSMADWLYFLGWFLSEGSLGDRKRYEIKISQTKEQHRPKIKKAIEALGYPVYEEDSGYRLYGKSMFEYLSQFGLSQDKFIPRELLKLAPHTLEPLYTSLIEGDGSVYKNGYTRFISISKQLIDDVSELALKMGKTPTVIPTNHERQRFENAKPCWHLGIRNRTEARINRKNLVRTKYKGKVHCVTVSPNHTVFIRYNNRISVSGQSAEFAAIAVDELTKNTEDVFDDLRNRLRWPGITDIRFLGATNPGGIGHCVPFGDVLTESGWKLIKDVRVGDKVLTLQDDGTQGFVPVAQVIAEPFDGELYESDNWSARFSCTPNHKIAVCTETKTMSGRTFHEPQLREVQDLPSVTRLPLLGQWVGEEIKTFSVPEIETRKVKIPQPTTIRGDDYAELMGWFLSEGSARCDVGRKLFSISQMKVANRDRIRQLLSRIGFTYTETATEFVVHSPHWSTYLTQFGKCRDKFVPREICNANPRQLALFMETLFLGDGHGMHYYTISKRLADDVQEIAHKLELRTYVSSRQRKNRKGLSYDVSLKLDKIGWIERARVRRTPFKGMVYCLGIKNIHRFYLRQNGTIYLSGNSWVKKRWLDRIFEEQETEPDQFVYIRALAQDNPHIDKSYLKQLESLPADKRRAYLEGDWDIFKGQYFTEWRKEIHVCAPFQIPEDWRKFIAGDYGHAAPSSVGWFAMDPDGALYLYRELYRAGMTYTQLAEEVSALTSPSEKIEYEVWDPALWSKKGERDDNLSGAEVYERRRKETSQKSPWMVKGDNSRVLGWQEVREWLRPFLGQQKALTARFQAFSTCPEFLRTFPALIHDEHNPEDVDSDGEDHAGDMLRYGVMSRPRPAKSRADIAKAEFDLAMKRKKSLSGASKRLFVQ